MRIKNYAVIVLSGVCFFVFANIAIAGEKLTAKQVKELISNKTYDGYSEKSGKSYRVYDSADGSHKVIFPNGNEKIRFWKVNAEGLLCVAKKKNKKGRCKAIIAVGNGVYNKVNDDGDVRQILKNFVEGNKL